LYDHSVCVGQALIETLKGTIAVMVFETTGCGTELALQATEHAYRRHVGDRRTARSFLLMYADARQYVIRRPQIATAGDE
jgi:hypothetical protein